MSVLYIHFFDDSYILTWHSRSFAVSLPNSTAVPDIVEEIRLVQIRGLRNWNLETSRCTWVGASSQRRFLAPNPPLLFNLSAGVRTSRQEFMDAGRNWTLGLGGGADIWWSGEEEGGGGQVRGGLMVKQRGPHIPWVFAMCAQQSWQPSIGQKDPLCLHRSGPSVRLSVGLIWLGLNSFVGTLSAARGWKIQLTEHTAHYLNWRGRYFIFLSQVFFPWQGKLLISLRQHVCKSL